jgi:hypothetical protein
MTTPQNSQRTKVAFPFAPDYPPLRMDIYSEPGTPIIFDSLGGYADQKRQAQESLIEGQRYLVRYIHVESSSSTVSLVGVEGRFNTCLFAHIEGVD